MVNPRDIAANAEEEEPGSLALLADVLTTRPSRRFKTN